MPATISPPSAEPGAAVVSPVPNVTEAAEPGGELDDAKAVQGGHVGVEPPAQPLVKLLGPVDAGHRDDLHLQVHVDRPGGRVATGVITACFGGAHACLLERFLQVVAYVALRAGAPRP